MTDPQLAPYKEFKGNQSSFYETTPEVAELVNCAIYLGRPILVEGEAGCGKTTLARAIADELGLDKPVSITVKSTSQAKDLLYRFNALQRLQEIQDPQRTEARYIYPYIRLQPLGQAIHDSKPCVVLIDEIDKADIDFPNDLLEVLNDFRFTIDDLPREEDELCFRAQGFGRLIEGQNTARPIVVITSNREKPLPEPFLRRCLYVELKFPDDPTMLAGIVRKNLGISPEGLSEQLIGVAVKRFLKLRTDAVQTGMQKPPATSELIDWINVLHWKGDVVAGQLISGATPYWQLLFKTMQDLDAYASRSKGQPE